MKAHRIALALATLLGLTLAPQTHAQILDEIEIAQAQDTTEARIQLNAPVHYLRHFPAGNAKTFELFFQIISTEGIDHMTSDEYKVAPPSEQFPHFTVTYPKQGASRLILQFCRAVDLKVRLGEDNRSFVLSIKPINTETQPAAEPCKVDSQKNLPATHDTKPATENTTPAGNTNTPPAEIKMPAIEPQQPATENTQPASEASK